MPGLPVIDAILSSPTEVWWLLLGFVVVEAALIRCALRGWWS